jgi:flagellar P-ring protein precursor FlgI
MVNVTAQLPAFAKAGMQLDLRVATIGDASSLYGGTLMTTILRGVDGVAYATGDGPLAVSGFAVGKQGGTRVQRNNPTVGRVARGGTVVRDLKSNFLSERGDLELGLLNPNLATAQAIAVAVNGALQAEGIRAGVVDENLVRIELPERRKDEAEAIRVLNRIRDLQVRVENPATVIIDEAAGIVLAGEGVRISPCVVALSDLTISVVSEDEVVQPDTPFTRGETATVNRTRIDVQTGGAPVRALGQGGATVAELLANLKALELSPRQLIEVFDFLAAGGYLQAKLVKQ